MRCGTAEADITPSVGCELSGFVAREQPSTGVHDRLMATALYIEGGGGTLLWLHAELIGFEREDVLRLKARLEQRHGLRPDQVLITATHTHSGPATVRLSGCGAYDGAYVEQILYTLESLAVQAINTSEEADLSCGEGSCDLGVNRRGAATAHTDPRVTVLRFSRNHDNRRLAHVIVYGLHNVAMGPGNRLMSGDVFGDAARRISAGHGGIVIVANGACGNVNPPSVGDDFDRVAKWGRLLTGAVCDAAAIPNVDEVTIRTAIGAFEAAPDSASPEEVEAVLRGMGDPGVGPIADRVRAAMSDWNARMQADDARNSAWVDLQAIRLGPVCFVAFGGEMFSGIGDELRAATSEHIVPVTYANGDAGYLMPAAAYDEGGYETDAAFVFYGTRPIPRGAYERARGLAMELVESLR